MCVKQEIAIVIIEDFFYFKIYECSMEHLLLELLVT